jgi:hypothetical protein
MKRILITGNVDSKSARGAGASAAHFFGGVGISGAAIPPARYATRGAGGAGGGLRRTLQMAQVPLKQMAATIDVIVTSARRRDGIGRGR